MPQPQTAFGLDLFNSKITDAGLKDLAGLKNLQSLDLFGVKVTPPAVAELRKALPALKIETFKIDR